MTSEACKRAFKSRRTGLARRRTCHSRARSLTDKGHSLSIRYLSRARFSRFAAGSGAFPFGIARRCLFLVSRAAISL
jgi:hypothetical protein